VTFTNSCNTKDLGGTVLFLFLKQPKDVGAYAGNDFLIIKFI
jgi:hypothetical protein